MTETKELEEDLQFVVKHFKEGSLIPCNGWRQFKLIHHLTNFKRNIAAASIAAVVLAASASVYYISTHSASSPTEEQTVNVITNAPISSDNKTAKIEFKNAPLDAVVAEIERIYEVRITNIPEEQIMVTLSYEGTASDLVETINDLFEINLKIASQAE